MDREEYIKALRTSIKKFDRLRKEKPWPNMDLSGANLSNSDLTNAQLGRINFRGADFSNTNLSYTNLAHTDLRYAKFSGAIIKGANLHKAQLENADFRGANISGLEEDGRICINSCMFKNVKWNKEQLTYFINILNQSEDWEIKFNIIPKPSKG